MMPLILRVFASLFDMLYLQDKLSLLGILTETSPIVPVTYSETEGLQSYLSRIGLVSHMLLLMGYHPPNMNIDL